VTVTSNPKDAPEEDEEEEDLFGSDEEEEDAEAVAEREKRLADYKKKKEGKAKPAAKSIVTLDVKPWGEFFYLVQEKARTYTRQMTRRTWTNSHRM
jgi:elongation factor 1-beta